MTTNDRYNVAKVNEVKAIYFDMDGTIADLYGQNEWLECIKRKEVTPYENAEPMFNTDEMEEVIKVLKEQGYIIGVITYTAWGCTKEYGNAIRKAKKEWLKKFFPYADELHITNNKKEKVHIAKTPRGYLLDDDEHNVNAWTAQNNDRNGYKRVGVKVNGNVTEMLKAIANNEVHAIN